jgi:hypothetical protein
LVEDHGQPSGRQEVATGNSSRLNRENLAFAFIQQPKGDRHRNALGQIASTLIPTDPVCPEVDLLADEALSRIVRLSSGTGAVPFPAEWLSHSK